MPKYKQMNNSKYKTPFDSLPISFPFLKTSASRERETSPHKKKKKKGAAMDLKEFLLKILLAL